MHIASICLVSATWKCVTLIERLARLAHRNGYAYIYYHDWWKFVILTRVSEIVSLFSKSFAVPRKLNLYAKTKYKQFNDYIGFKVLCHFARFIRKFPFDIHSAFGGNSLSCIQIKLIKWTSAAAAAINTLLWLGRYRWTFTLHKMANSELPEWGKRGSFPSFTFEIWWNLCEKRPHFPLPVRTIWIIMLGLLCNMFRLVLCSI